MPFLLFARHGNTFEKEQKATWVGSRTDLPLTQEGEAQARALARKLRDAYLPLGEIISGPLARTKRFAEIVAQEIKAPFHLDPRLTEIDYGLWENKTNEQIVALYGSEPLDKWENAGERPEAMKWSPSEEELQKSLGSFLEEQRKALDVPNAPNRLAVTSNGILRAVYRSLTGRAPDKMAKVKTGSLCVLSPSREGWEIRVWNEASN